MHNENKHMFNKLSIFLIAVFISIPLFSFNVYAQDNIGDTITDIRFGTNESDNNFKYSHGVFSTDNDYYLTEGDYGNLKDIESRDPDDSVQYNIQYNYDLDKYRLALKKGDVKIDIYTNSNSFYEDVPWPAHDNYERPQFEVYYGYSDDKWDVEDKKFSETSGSSNSGKEFWFDNPNNDGNPSPLPSNLRYIRINFHTQEEDAGGKGFAATYHNMYFYLTDNGDPQIKKVSSSASDSGTLSIGDSVYINVDFDEAVTINNDSKIKINIVDMDGNPVYASYVWDEDEEHVSYYRVKYKYTIEEGDYIPDSDSKGYAYANINDQSKFAYVYSNNEYNYYIYDLGHRMYFANDNGNSITEDFNSNIKVDGTKSVVTNVEILSDNNSQYYTKYNKYYKKGDNIYFKITFDDAVYYSSTSVKLNLTEDRQATYISGKGSNEIVFEYKVEDKILNNPDDPIDIVDNDLFSDGYLKDTNGNETYETTNISLYDSWVRVDNTLPVINVDYDENNVYKKLHEVYIEAIDEDSSISEIKYIWKETDDYSAFNWDDASICVSRQIVRNPKDANGEYKLFIRAKDCAGNTSIYESGLFNIDNNAPEVTVMPNGGNITTLDSLVEITGTDVFSETSLYFQWVKVETEDEKPGYDDNLWRKYTKSFYIHETGALNDGNYRLYVKAIDELGNESITISKAFIVGNDAMLTITPSSTNYETSYDIEILAEKEASISYVFSTNPIISMDSESWNDPVTVDRLSFPGYTGDTYEGIVYLHVKATVDGKNYYKRVSYMFDKTSPIIELETFTLSDKPVQFAAVKVNIDDMSKVKIYSKWDDEVEWTKEEGNVITRDNGEGQHTLQIKAVDEAGNITIQDKILKDDVSIDVVYDIDSISPSGSIVETNITTSGVINVSQEAIDGLTTKENLKYSYSINDGATWYPWTNYSETFEIEVTTTGAIDLGVKYLDEAGNESDIYKEQLDVGTITSGSGINITYSTKQDMMTNEPVIATVNINQELLDEGYKVINNEEKNTYEFTENGTFKFELENTNKETYEITAFVNNIDLEKPKVITKAFSTMMPTNKSVTMTILIDEPVKFDSELVTMLGTKGYKHQYTFEENDNIMLDFKDEAGNISTISADVNWIDLDAPHITYSLDIEEITASNVTATISADEEIRILNNNGLDHRTFSDNGKFEFEVEDLAGNKIEYVVTVSNIDRNLPKLWIEYSTETVTKGAVIATVKSDIEMIVLNNDGNETYTFDKNGAFTFVVKDVEKDILYDVDAVVTNIDKKAPEITFEHYDNGVFVIGGSYTLNDYILIDNMDENLEDQIEIDETDFNIDEPGTYTIKYRVWDDAGNEKEYLREVEVVNYDDFSIYINGNKVNDYNQIVIEDNKAVIQVFTQGKHVVYGKNDKYKQNQLKSGSEYIKNNTILVNEEGWYSVYILDQERNTKYIRIYFVPNNK